MKFKEGRRRKSQIKDAERSSEVMVNRDLNQLASLLLIPPSTLCGDNRRLLLETSKAHLVVPTSHQKSTGNKPNPQGIKGTKTKVHLVLCNDLLLVFSSSFLKGGKQRSAFSLFSKNSTKRYILFLSLEGLRVQKTVKSNKLFLTASKLVSSDLLKVESKEKTLFTDSQGNSTFILSVEKSHFHQLSSAIGSAVQILGKKLMLQKTEANVEKPVTTTAEPTSTSDCPMNKEEKKEISGAMSRPISPPTHRPLESNKSETGSDKRIETTEFSAESVEEAIGEFELRSVFDRMIEWHSSKETNQKRKTPRRGDLFLPLTSSFSSNSTKEKVKDNYVHCIRLLEEILSSERDYVLDLCTLTSCFLKPMSDKTKGTSLELDVRRIFGNVSSILEVNAELLKSLSDGVNKVGVREKHPSVEAIAAVFAREFLKHMAFLKMYSVYCHQYKQGLSSLEELRSTRADFDQLVTKCEANSSAGNLQNLLIKPVQRICKYPLLFRELFAQMKIAEERRGKDVLFSAVVQQINSTLEGIEKIAASVNDKVQDIENQQLVLQVFVELGGTLDGSKAGGSKDCMKLREILGPTRRFKGAFEVLLREHSHRNASRRVPCVLYLFNDLLVIGKLNSSQSLLGLMGARRANTFSSSGNNNSYLSGNSASASLSTNGGRSAMKQRAKLMHMFWLDEHTVRVKKSSGVVLYDEQKRCAFELLVSYSSEQKLAPSPQKSPGKQFVSSVEKFDVWCDDRITRDSLANEIAERIHDCRKQKVAKADLQKSGKRICAEELRRSFSSNSIVDTSNGSSLRQKRAARLQQMKSIDSNVNSLHQLDKLREKYASSNKSIIETGTKRQWKEYEVSFEEGMLGIAFQNGFNLESKANESDSDTENANGVFVATVAESGQASKKGVAVGDKLLAVQETILGEDATWKQVFDMMGNLARPISVKFLRLG